jgi:hypothetical protein
MQYIHNVLKPKADLDYDQDKNTNLHAKYIYP